MPAADREMLSSSRDQATRCLAGLGETLEAIEEFARGSEDLSGRLHHEVLASRMRPLADGIRGFPRLVRDVSRAARQAGEVRGRRRDHRRRSRHPRRTRGAAQSPDPQRPGPRARDARRTAALPARIRRGRSGSRHATARGCSRSFSPTTAGASTWIGSAKGRREGSDDRLGRQPAERGRAARFPVPARLLDQGDRSPRSRAGASDSTSCRAWSRQCAGRSGSAASSARERGSFSSCRSPSR